MDRDIARDTWVHVAGVYEPGRIKLYIQGGPAGEVATVLGPGYASDNRGWIGCRQRSTPSFEGDLDDVRVYNRVLTAAEITALAQ